MSWGKEVFSPVRYNSVEVGPYSVTVQVRAGESPEQAWDRAMRWLEQQVEREWGEKVRAHLGRVDQAVQLVGR